MRKIVAIILILFILASCSGLSAYDMIHNKILDFNTVSYDMILRTISNKNENTYKLSVKVNKTGGCTVEISEPRESGRIYTEYGTDIVRQKNLKIGDEVIYKDNSRFFTNPIFLSSFLSNYLQYKDEQIIRSDTGDYKVEVPIKGGNFYFYMQQLIFDGKTLEPKTMSVYGEDGRKVIETQIKMLHQEPSLM